MSWHKSGRKMSRGRSLISDEVLTVLRKPVSYIPPSIRTSNPAKEFQLFEVLSAYIMSLIESDFEWTVTPLQHDRGVDFYGERTLFRLPGLEEHVRMVIAGQCKASKNVKTPLPSDLWQLLDSVHPSVVFVFLMSAISRRRIEAAEKIFCSQTHRQCRILGLNDVIRLVQLYRQEILQFIHRSLGSKDERVLRVFIDDLPAEQPEKIEVKARVPAKALAGSPFHIQVNVHSLLLCKSAIRVRWDYPSDVVLIKPAALATPEGMLLEGGEGFSSSFSLKLVSYHVGEVPLGELVFEVEGTPVKTVPLNTLATVDQYHPAFFWEPYQQQRSRFLELLDKAEAGAPEGVAVTGQGGAGKTRFCQELGYLAEQRGGEFVSVSHPQDLEHPYKIFGLLTQALLPKTSDPLNPKEALETHILSLHPKLYQKAKSTIAVIFSSEGGDCGVFDREAMLQVLLVMLLRAGGMTTHILHFSDLHWASAEALEILGDLLERVKKVAAEYRAAVLILFEGRVQTNLKYSGGGPGQANTTAIFESFVERYRLEQLSFRPFSATRSRAFLKHLFETAQSVGRRVPRALIPHQEALIEEIARYGQGNPFHMIEQIKLLRQEGLVARNQRTGLIYLTGRPRSSYQVPTSVYDLIALRLKFIEDTSPELALLIKSVGLIKSRINAQLFRKLHRSLAGHTPDAAVQEAELLDISDPSEVSFRHENYYQVVGGSPLTQAERRKVTELYLRWYEGLRPKTAEVLYEEALVHTNRLRVDVRLVRRLLTSGLRKAEGCHQFQLAVQIVEKLLNAFPTQAAGSAASSTLLNSLRLRAKLAVFLNDLRDWNLGAEQHERVVADIDNYLLQASNVSPALRSTLSYLRTSSMVGLANSNTDLGRAHRSVRLLREAREVCETYFGLGIATSPKEREKWNVLYGQVLNRLGEANWMDGNYSEALRSMEQATEAVEEKVQSAEDRRLLHHINYLDYGAVLLHEAPRKAVRMLKKSLSLVPEKGWSPQYIILARTTVVIGEMVELFLREKANSPHFRRFLEGSAVPRLQQDFEKALFYGFKQEQVAASLMLGISLSLLDDRGAGQWYMESIESGFRSNNLESLWRGHLNLAQYLASGGEKEASFFHCHRALELLSNDLRDREPHERRWRQRHLTRPLARIATLLPASEVSADPFVRALLKDAGSERGGDIRHATPDFFSDKIIFFGDRGNEYYPYGG